VGIPQGQLTYHFRHRADLVLAVTDSAMDLVAEYLWRNNPELASRSFTKLVGMVMNLMLSKTRMRALLGLIAEADESPEVLERLMAQGK
jgi:AcrR family transcriptional regulator